MEYHNLQEALKAEPKLRYNYQRIDEKERIRVVKIGDFDVAACVREHVKSTAELVAFSLSNINYRRDETEVNYLVGKEAIDFANSMKNITLLIKREFNSNNPFAAVKNAIEELRNNKKTLASLIKTYLKEKKCLIIPQEIELDKEIRDAVIDAAGKEGFAILISGNNIFAFSQSNLLESLSKHLKGSSLIKGIAKENIISGKILDINQVSLLIEDFLSNS
jgi:alanyl-tRNA synthetase